MSRKLGLLIALLAIFALTLPVAVSAAPSFTYVGDDAGANDEPGQKDLTAQAAAQDAVAPNHFFTSWKWDDIQWTGGNTGDGCSLFDTDTSGAGDGLVDYALCATVRGGKDAATVQLVSFKLYSCADTRSDRCAGPTELLSKTATAGDYCTVIDSDTGQFDAADTTIICDITLIAAEAGITVFGTGTLLNTCSYPSREPNSDPSDCVLTDFPDDTTTVTTPSGSATFTATLNDSAQVTPAAAGNVVFRLFSDATCTTQVFTATVATNAAGVATTSTTTSTAGTYYWTADFTPTDPSGFNPSASACGSEVVTVTAATVN